MTDVPTDVPDSRREPRFILDPPIEGNFGELSVSIYNIGESGIQVEHKDAIARGSEDRLRFFLPVSDKVINVRGRVMWSRQAKKSDPLMPWPYRSGIKVDGLHQLTLETLAKLLALSVVKHDRNSLARKKAIVAQKAKTTPAEPLAGAPLTLSLQEAIHLVQNGRTFLVHHPVEMAEALSRGRKNLPAIKGESVAYSDEIIAVWAYLNGAMELKMVAMVVDLFPR